MKHANEPKTPISQMAGQEPKQAAPNTGGQQHQDPKSDPKSSPGNRNTPKDAPSSPSHGKDKDPAQKQGQGNEDQRS